MNECLFKGPKLNEIMLDVLMRFRVHPIVFIADIKQAFLRVGVREGDRDFLRFLWIKDIKSENPIIEAYRYNTLVFGLTCSPFLLNATLKHHLNKYKSLNKNEVEQLERSLYVDDISSGAGSVEGALNLYKMAEGILKKEGLFAQISL